MSRSLVIELEGSASPDSLKKYFRRFVQENQETPGETERALARPSTPPRLT